jgi:hypothetical protein
MIGCTYFQQDRKTHWNSYDIDSCMLWFWGLDYTHKEEMPVTCRGNGLCEKCKIFENDRLLYNKMRRICAEETRWGSVKENCWNGMDM